MPLRFAHIAKAPAGQNPSAMWKKICRVSCDPYSVQVKNGISRTGGSRLFRPKILLVHRQLFQLPDQGLRPPAFGAGFSLHRKLPGQVRPTPSSPGSLLPPQMPPDVPFSSLQIIPR